MAIHLTHVGGGAIGAGNTLTEPLGQFFPQGVPSCCDNGLPDASAYYDPKYVSEFAPNRMEALKCYVEQNRISAGDKFLMSIIHAGIDLHTLVYRSDNNCPGAQFHFELHDLFALLQEKAGGPPSVAELTFPATSGRADVHINVRAANGGNPYFGPVNGSVTRDNRTICCAQHKALVLVLDALPDPEAEATNDCGHGCGYSGGECGAGKGLRCLDIKASAHVYVPHGIQYV